MMNKVQDLNYKGRHFVIVKHESGKYCAIDDQYITNGKLNRVLNGFQMHANDELENCIGSVKFEIDIQELMNDKGLTIEEAFQEYLSA